MLQIEYPAFSFRFKEEQGKEFIFDEIRKKWVRLTPEEWVRQNFIQYLLQVKKYPSSIIAVEKEIRLGDLKKRCDIVVYKSHLPWMIIECKEQDVILNDVVLQQILRYNITLQSAIIVVTNGSVSYAFNLNKDGVAETDMLPEWE
ncbi:type I restriction enzyme HsdR N-terminal domain-containing protein [Panacibacter ginsenosidivorans]|uniref:Type I restriction enzyme HsdR N-terminal domain-containing protein n=1 Tax=Panacibacter ginsenosidivorans TaxID=1813871 RepID=A0A5B8VDR0_9BACT|nr:type I restriction enzyme HsdR N-terminal domain-containing protein [Panacibacter ginsenosidivorans]QEC69111.1 type I restriction enzyme HsdR N-terminal domain-containing protein [Panacibacter ginsenosidivorans]